MLALYVQSALMYTYLLINLFTLLPPLSRAFEPRMRFYKEWPFLFTGIFVAGLIFILWDVIFTRQGIWGFNPDYLCGIEISHLPIEEWLFFLTVPYASIFIYATFGFFVPLKISTGFSRIVSLGLGLLLLALSLYHQDRAYTHITFGLSAIILLAQGLFIKGPYMGRFFISYLIILVPFFLVNGILTGAVTAEPIVWYNDHENLSIRLLTIPVEDSVYGMLLLLIAVTVYEELRFRIRGGYSYSQTN